MFKLKEEILKEIRKTETYTYFICECCGEQNYYSTAGYWCDAAGKKIEMTSCENCYNKEPEGSVDTFEETVEISIEDQLKQVQFILENKIVPYKKKEEHIHKKIKKQYSEEELDQKVENCGMFAFCDSNLFKKSIKIEVNETFNVSILYDIGKNYGKEIIENDYFNWCCQNIENFELSYNNLKEILIEI